MDYNNAKSFILAEKYLVRGSRHIVKNGIL